MSLFFPGVITDSQKFSIEFWEKSSFSRPDASASLISTRIRLWCHLSTSYVSISYFHKAGQKRIYHVLRRSHLLVELTARFHESARINAVFCVRATYHTARKRNIFAVAAKPSPHIRD